MLPGLNLSMPLALSFKRREGLNAAMDCALCSRGQAQASRVGDSSVRLMGYFERFVLIMLIYMVLQS